MDTRVVKKTNTGTIEWVEELVDPDGDNLTLDEAILYEKNGNLLPSARQSPSWLTIQALQSTVQGETLLEVFFTVDVSGVDKGNDYRFRLKGSDPFESKTHFVTLEVKRS